MEPGSVDVDNDQWRFVLVWRVSLCHNQLQLTSGIRDASSTDTFRRLLKTHCFQQASSSPSDSPKCLRFGHWLTLCTLNIHLLTHSQTCIASCRCYWCIYRVRRVVLFSGCWGSRRASRSVPSSRLILHASWTLLPVQTRYALLFSSFFVEFFFILCFCDFFWLLNICGEPWMTWH